MQVYVHDTHTHNEAKSLPNSRGAPRTLVQLVRIGPNFPKSTKIRDNRAKPNSFDLNCEIPLNVFKSISA